MRYFKREKTEVRNTDQSCVCCWCWRLFQIPQCCNRKGVGYSICINSVLKDSGLFLTVAILKIITVNYINIIYSIKITREMFIQIATELFWIEKQFVLKVSCLKNLHGLTTQNQLKTLTPYNNKKSNYETNNLERLKTYQWCSGHFNNTVIEARLIKIIKVEKRCPPLKDSFYKDTWRRDVRDGQ